MDGKTFDISGLGVRNGPVSHIIHDGGLMNLDHSGFLIHFSFAAVLSEQFFFVILVFTLLCNRSNILLPELGIAFGKFTCVSFPNILERGK